MGKKIDNWSLNIDLGPKSHLFLQEFKWRNVKCYDWDQQLTSPLWTAPGGQNAARGAEPTQETNWIGRT